MKYVHHGWGFYLKYHLRGVIVIISFDPVLLVQQSIDIESASGRFLGLDFKIEDSNLGLRFFKDIS